jgi:hypothetical protein
MAKRTKADGCPIRCPLDTKKGKSRSRKRGKPPLDVRYFLDEIGVDSPSDRALACAETQANWPEGWSAVSDMHEGYIAYFRHEKDASAFKFLLVNAIMNGVDIGKRYRDKC